MTIFLNEYRCTCGEEWSDEADCMCNDQCPACGQRDIEPYNSEDVTAEPSDDEKQQLAEMADERARRQAELYGPIAEGLPNDQPGLVQAMREAMEDYHAAVMAGGSDSNAAQLAETKIEAIIWKANGYTNFACLTESGAATILGRIVAAKAGDVPLWSQPGEFLVDVDGMRCRVEYRGFAGIGGSFDFHAVDWLSPFISNTGYRSHFFQTVPPGLSVSEFAADQIRQLRYEDGRLEFIRPDSAKINKKPLPSWIKAGGSMYQQADGQMALAL